MKTANEVTATPLATSTAEGPAPTADPSRKPERRWRRRLIVLGILVVAVVACHAWILQFLGELLVVSDPLVSTDAVVVMGRSGPYRAIPIDEVADLYQKQLIREVLLIEDRSSRIVKAGIVPTLESVMTRELVKREMPATALTTLASEFRSNAEMSRTLGNWLKKHPDAHVTILCDQFYSRSSVYFASLTIDSSEFARIHWYAIPDKRYDVTNWWHTRQGIVEVVSAYVCLVHGYVIGEPAEPASRWDADEFERSLSERAAR